MSNEKNLIREVAAEIHWTQADVQRAIDSYGERYKAKKIFLPVV